MYPATTWPITTEMMVKPLRLSSQVMRGREVVKLPSGWAGGVKLVIDYGVWC